MGNNKKNMSNNTSSIVSKVWSFCNPLCDVSIGYGDYLEQLTYLLFLKMVDAKVSQNTTAKHIKSVFEEKLVNFEKEIDN